MLKIAYYLAAYFDGKLIKSTKFAGYEARGIKF
jgi:hypothetical protein